MTDTNWRELSAGPELDRIVAKRLGYRIEKEMYAPFLSAVWVLTRPGDHGEKDYAADLEWTLDEAWSRALAPEIETSGEIVSLVAIFSRDAAAPLPLAEGYEFELRETAHKCGARMNSHVIDDEYHSHDEPLTGWEYAPTLALARVRAWLAHDDAKRDAVSEERQ